MALLILEVCNWKGVVMALLILEVCNWKGVTDLLADLVDLLVGPVDLLADHLGDLPGRLLVLMLLLLVDHQVDIPVDRLADLPVGLLATIHHRLHLAEKMSTRNTRSPRSMAVKKAKRNITTRSASTRSIRSTGIASTSTASISITGTIIPPLTKKREDALAWTKMMNTTNIVTGVIGTVSAAFVICCVSFVRRKTVHALGDSVVKHLLFLKARLLCLYQCHRWCILSRQEFRQWEEVGAAGMAGVNMVVSVVTVAIVSVVCLAERRVKAAVVVALGSCAGHCVSFVN